MLKFLSSATKAFEKVNDPAIINATRNFPVCRFINTSNVETYFTKATNVELMQTLRLALAPETQIYKSTVDPNSHTSTLAGDPKCITSFHKEIRSEVLARWNQQPMLMNSTWGWIRNISVLKSAY